jgi:hypothetical protein
LNNIKDDPIRQDVPPLKRKINVGFSPGIRVTELATKKSLQNLSLEGFFYGFTLKILPTRVLPWQESSASTAVKGELHRLIKQFIQS